MHLMNKKTLPITIFTFDLLIIFFCFFKVFTYYNGFVPIPIKSISLIAFITIVWYFLNLSLVKHHSFGSNLIETLKNLLICYSLLSVSIIFVVAAFGQFAPNNKLILWPLLFSVLLSSIFRIFISIVLKFLIKNHFKKNVILIGSGRILEIVLQRFLSSDFLDLNLYGVISDNKKRSIPKNLYLGKLVDFRSVLNSEKIDDVIIALPLKMESQIADIVNYCETEGVRARIVPDFFKVVRTRAILDNLKDIPLIGIRPEPLSLFSNRLLKRSFDILISITILIVLFPLLIILGLLCKLTSSGPALFTQERIGANNREFVMYKFRSMFVQDKNVSDTTWTVGNDHRITPFGRIMRRFNLDELPQFWNVLIGDMSIIGPRPEREHFVNNFKKYIKNYNVRHLVKSGITGWSQINGFIGDTSIQKRIEYDIYYIENWSLLLDLKIFFLTILWNLKPNSQII